MFDIKGFMKTSMLDYPEKIASVVFLPRCNFHCPYCHNKELVVNDPRLIPFETEGVLDFLRKKKKWIDGVVISGGEPTLHNELPGFCKKVKGLGFSVKLDTNGTNPEMIKKLIDEKLVDYFAMDIKSSKDHYEKAASVKVNMKAVEDSIRLLMNSNADYEFRTTVVPGLVTEEDIVNIGRWLKGARKYYLQQFVPIKTLNDSYMKKEPYPNSVLLRMREAASKYVDECIVRGM